jgi:GrpB-like predicted nucleotidyltransferase (UPF0157 family)
LWSSSISSATATRQVSVVEHDPAWPRMYSLVADRIRQALGTSIVELDHIGSTLVAGLPAKPVIDIDLTVDDSSEESAYVPALEAAGFRLVIRERGWHEHRVLTTDNPRTNLHVFSPDCPEVIRHRMFRDWPSTHHLNGSRRADLAGVGGGHAEHLAAADAVDPRSRPPPVSRVRCLRCAGLPGRRAPPPTQR